jgi:hypothetical protein
MSIIMAREGHPYLTVIIAIEGPPYLPIIMARERPPMPAYYNGNRAASLHDNYNG